MPKLFFSGEMVFDKQSSRLHLLILAIFSAAVFLPMLGRGFIHDDFVHLYSASRDSLQTGLTTATGGPFYAPLAWLSYRADWFLWGKNAFPMAAENLLLHIAVLFLLYLFVLRLWGSKTAAFWAAFGFALLFPSNTWAVMWISTRAHLLTTAFYLAAMIAMLGFIRVEGNRVFSALAVVAFGFVAIFSKESGVTLPAALAVLLIYEKRTNAQFNVPLLKTVLIFAALILIIAVYLWLRAASGAVPLNFSLQDNYRYSFAAKVLWSNFLEYFWRSYGLLIIFGAAIAVSRLMTGARLRFNLLTRNEILFSAVLYAVMISPFFLLPIRSGIYTYLPSVAAALLLGAAVRSFEQNGERTGSRLSVLKALPILLIAAIYTGFTVGHSLKWIRMAQTTGIVLNQISALVPAPEPRTFFVLRFNDFDRANRFPDGFATWAFPSALKLHYSDPTLDGKIVRPGEAYFPQNNPPEIHLAYTLEDSAVKIIKTK